MRLAVLILGLLLGAVMVFAAPAASLVLFAIAAGVGLGFAAT
jgi:hypothetical protein